MRKIEYIIVHCSESEWGSAREIRNWHLQRGFRDIGYHFVLLNGRITPNLTIAPLNGSIELGRPLDEEGAHCIGFNAISAGICAVAKSKWTESQEISLIVLCRELQRQFKIPTGHILGHYETASGAKEGKTCPNMNMDVVRGLVEGNRF